MKTESSLIIAGMFAKNGGDWNKTYEDIKKKNLDNKIDVSGDFITILDKEYPESLKQTYKPPFVLFYKGNLDLLNEKNIVSLLADYSYDYSWDIVKEFLEDDTYVVDANCRFVLNLARDKKVIVVLNNSLDADKELVEFVVKHNGLVITECLEGTKDINDFTRIVSGLETKRGIVVNCARRSYGYRQISYSLRLGHEIYVMPTNATANTINNQLISEGAYILFK